MSLTTPEDEVSSYISSADSLHTIPTPTSLQTTDGGDSEPSFPTSIHPSRRHLVPDMHVRKTSWRAMRHRTSPKRQEPEDLHFSDVVKAVKGKDVFKTEHHVAALKYFMPSGRISDRTKQQVSFWLALQGESQTAPNNRASTRWTLPLQPSGCRWWLFQDPPVALQKGCPPGFYQDAANGSSQDHRRWLFQDTWWLFQDLGGSSGYLPPDAAGGSLSGTAAPVALPGYRQWLFQDAAKSGSSGSASTLPGCSGGSLPGCRRALPGYANGSQDT
ncbi:hypothetical protein CYMTET_17041 [Cymbomonas tetramitiformis]|uniref:Uncharacterized protein n=1 Tax=Cymbomonas tetramitiformis TaxID=36881 RepID=A0AAE0GC88_9CHLO|nr:hypothetical protein CYMTET_17041 [Cymbomonas tetramitiformis]